MADSAEHVETMQMILAAVAHLKGIPRDRFKAWAKANTTDDTTAEDLVGIYDDIDDMLETDYREDT